MANLSTFPTTVDTFIEHYEIQASDITNVQTYQSLLVTPNLTPAQQSQLSQLTSTLRDKLISADDFNKLQDCITNLETFFLNNVNGYIQTQQQNFTATLQQFTYLGTYSATVTYQQWNIVTYNNNTYMCLINGTSGITPTNTTNWAEIAPQGVQGIQGPAGAVLSYIGNYSSTATYEANNLVGYNNNIYICTVNGTTNIIPTTTSNWNAFIAESTSIGNLALLDTTNTPDLVSAINQVYTDLNNIFTENNIWNGTQTFNGAISTSHGKTTDLYGATTIHGGVGITVNSLAVPVISTVTNGTSGAVGTYLVASTAYSYELTAVSYSGVETSASASVSVTTGATPYPVTVNWSALSTDTEYVNVYKNGDFLAQVSGSSVSYVDSGNTATTAQVPPALNLTGEATFNGVVHAVSRLILPVGSNLY